MTDTAIHFARACFLSAVRSQEMLARSATQRIVMVGQMLGPPADPDATITETNYPPEIRPMADRNMAIIDAYQQGIAALASTDPVGERLASACFDEVTRLVRGGEMRR